MYNRSWEVQQCFFFSFYLNFFFFFLHIVEVENLESCSCRYRLDVSAFPFRCADLEIPVKPLDLQSMLEEKKLDSDGSEEA